MPVLGAMHSLVTGLHGLVATGLLTLVAKAGTTEKIINIAAAKATINFFMGIIPPKTIYRKDKTKFVIKL